MCISIWISGPAAGRIVSVIMRYGTVVLIVNPKMGVVIHYSRPAAIVKEALPAPSEIPAVLRRPSPIFLLHLFRPFRTSSLIIRPHKLIIHVRNPSIPLRRPDDPHSLRRCRWHGRIYPSRRYRGILCQASNEERLIKRIDERFDFSRAEPFYSGKNFTGLFRDVLERLG